MVELAGNINISVRINQILKTISSINVGYCLSAQSINEGMTLSLNHIDKLEGTIVSFYPGKLAYYQSESALPRTFQCFIIDDFVLRKKARLLVDRLSGEYQKFDRRNNVN